ncbi:MAG TPA: threonine/serine dehydratase [Candidatus Acidoferrum sp.]|nr:threonine/serine dehydratase [Candidatus Acidoferrum sp.]
MAGEPCEGQPKAKGVQVSDPHRLSLQRIEQAASVIDPVFLNSPQFRAESFGQRLDCQVVVKVETLNPIRSFKGRGTEYLMATLNGRPRLVCATAGNFGQGMAFSARKRGLSLTIFAAVTANPLKVERMRALGAEVRLVGENFKAAHSAAKAFSTETGAELIEDGRIPAISEGAGTIGVELLRWPEQFDSILVPLGDGALLGGMARWVKAHHPTTQMIGVCASGAPAMERSWRAKQTQEFGRTGTIADGIAVQSPYPEAVADLIELADDILLVDDAALITAMRQAHQELGVVLEPAGAAGLAALNTHSARFKGQLTGTILTGGNITPEQMRQWLSAER